MTLSADIERTHDGVVVVPYADLLDGTYLGEHLEAALGNSEEALGIILVRGVPGMKELRERLLGLSNTHAQLPGAIQDETLHPTSKYQFGWSLGREIMNGRPDVSKGSYYANPLDKPIQATEEMKARFPFYLSENVWPREELVPGFRDTFCAFGQLIYETGLLLASHCDRFVTTRLPEEARVRVEKALRDSSTIKARLLHYFPRGGEEVGDEGVDSWCGWHVDHSFLTGLSSAIYTKADEHSPSPVPERDASLRIKDRARRLHTVSIPTDCIAFQIGQALQLASGNHLQATAHCVSRPVDPSLARDTFVVFMQPHLETRVTAELDFAGFTEEILKGHYDVVEG